ncbi:DUF2721 domain-containing protein [Luteimonas aestuarii]|uniref:DUF2721 domain-containing protein n=1 Tax=Luteimonas aestuarii TaxID=453837 RepID=A0A4V3ALK8_9GAMM|nr:DUF2721 domain-containing protein [Luteimonas aestuarii]
MQNAALSHYAILTAMLAPAFFLTATAALLASANARLARIIDRARQLLKDLASSEDAEARTLLERRIKVQRRRSMIILRASQMLYVAIACFVATSLLVALDSYFDHVFGPWPTIMAVLGVLSMFGSSLLLASEASMAVRAVNDEMDDAHRNANRRSPLL